MLTLGYLSLTEPSMIVNNSDDRETVQRLPEFYLFVFRPCKLEQSLPVVCLEFFMF